MHGNIPVPKSVRAQMLKRALVIPLTAVACLSVYAALAAAAAVPSAAGVWKQMGNDGKVGALVTISEEGKGVFIGRLSKLFSEPGDDPNPVCRACPGEKKGAPLLGLTFIEGMKQSGLEYSGGTILDPESGRIYHASMELSPDGEKLTVRGYIGFPVLGQSQTWTRVQ
jgi:uncharacterized protein (DUF2147 family)